MPDGGCETDRIAPKSMTLEFGDYFVYRGSPAMIRARGLGGAFVPVKVAVPSDEYSPPETPFPILRQRFVPVPRCASTIRSGARTSRLRVLRMVEKTIVERAAEKVGYGLAMAEDVAGTVKTAVGAAVTTVTNALTPAKEAPKKGAKKSVAKSIAKKAPAKKAAKKTGAKKSLAKKTAAKKAAKKSVKAPAKKTVRTRR